MHLTWSGREEKAGTEFLFQALEDRLGGGRTDRHRHRASRRSKPPHHHHHHHSHHLPIPLSHLHPRGSFSPTARMLGQRSPYPRAPLVDRSSYFQRRRPPRPAVSTGPLARSMRPLGRRTHTPGSKEHAEGLESSP